MNKIHHGIMHFYLWSPNVPTWVIFRTEWRATPGSIWEYHKEPSNVWPGVIETCCTDGISPHSCSSGSVFGALLVGEKKLMKRR